MAGVSEDDIQTFLIVANINSREIASIFLKGNNCKLDEAVDAYLRDPNPSRFEKQLQWDETAWTEARHGGGASMVDDIPAFQVNDDAPDSFGPLGAPSRPPSRTQQGYVTGIEYGPSLDDYQRSYDSGQMTGVISASGHEYVPDLEPSERMRQDGEPAFLKPLPRHDFLPALLTILHTIPQCREALLFRDNLLDDYGESPQWWEGDDVRRSAISFSENLEDFSDSRVDQRHEDGKLIHETQRLMAFLDNTHRSYGSAASLRRLPAVDMYQYNSPLYDRFLLAWERAANSFMQLNQRLFTSVIRPDPESDWDEQDVRTFSIMPQDPKTVQSWTLYDALDEALWQRISFADEHYTNWIRSIAPLVTIGIARQLNLPNNERFKIPLQLYADRYLEANASYIIETQNEAMKYRQEVDSLERSLTRIQTFVQHGNTQQTGSARSLFLAIADHLDNNKGKAQAHTKEVNSVESEDDSLSDTHFLLSKLQEISEKLDARIEALNDERDKALEAMHDLSSRMTVPSQDESVNPTHKYTLQGVALSLSDRVNTLYIKTDPNGPKLVDVDNDGPAEQWWKISYDVSSGGAKVHKEKVEAADALQGARQANAETLLVYAIDGLLSSENVEGLPPQLESFVQADNNAFRAELDTRTHILETIEGHAVDDTDMIDSNRASPSSSM